MMEDCICRGFICKCPHRKPPITESERLDWLIENHAKLGGSGDFWFILGKSGEYKTARDAIDAAIRSSK